jgi:hypothetical protein
MRQPPLQKDYGVPGIDIQQLMVFAQTIRFLLGIRTSV